MDPLSDTALARLRLAVELPDLSGTRYRMLEPIGRGGMGAVYLVEDAVLQRPVAMKVLNGLGAGPDAAQRLRQEALILARLEHPGIVPVHDAGTLADGRVFYAMKHMRGRRLDQYAADGPPLHERLEVFRRICETVASAHVAEVVHRDLKPENIMVGAFGEVVVMDWGVAKVLSAAAEPLTDAGPGASDLSRTPRLPAGVESIGPDPLPSDAAGGTGSGAPTLLTLHGTVLGTPGYMAPEQARGDTDQVSPQTDVFALGGLLHFLICLRPPPVLGATAESAGAGHTRPPVPERADVAPGAPHALRAICRKAMAHDPGARYAGAQALADDVARFLARLPVSAHRETIWGRSARLAARYRAALWILGAYLAMRLVFIVWLRA